MGTTSRVTKNVTGVLPYEFCINRLFLESFKKESLLMPTRRFFFAIPDQFFDG